MQAADVPASLHLLVYSEVRNRVLAHTLLVLIIATADAGPLPSLLLLVCEEQLSRTSHECMKCHPHMFPREC